MRINVDNIIKITAIICTTLKVSLNIKNPSNILVIGSNVLNIEVYVAPINITAF